ncbi:MAG: YeiH family protein [Prevotellaceae bacterium]|nr:YeiH family protein [Prevotellaceae bacterium]
MKDKIYGIFLITVMSVVAWHLAMVPAIKALSLSSLIMGILLGMIFANTLRSKVPASWEPGLKFCSKRMLRTGIILYGFRLTFQDVVEVGAAALVVDAIVVVGTICLGYWLGKIIGLDRDSTLLTSVGSAICGAAAVLGAEPIVKGEAHKTAVAVSTVVIFGTISMFLYPIAYRVGILDGLYAQQIGIYTGSTLHEVAHVVGAGNAMANDIIAPTALIVKMVRVILLVPVLLVMSWWLSKGAPMGGEKGKINVPWFAFIFLLMIGVNSVLQSMYGMEEWLANVRNVINVVSTFMLTMAMTALGADTSLAKFRQAGAKPFYLAGMIYVWLVVGGYLMAKFLVPLMR